MLFDGDIPGLTEEEERAFAELAPVYQPKRSRRLTYESRCKHSKVELIRLAHRLREEREALEARAKQLDIPIEIETGILTHIDEEGQPYYSGSLGIGSCDSISSDEVWTTNAAGQVNTNFNLSGGGVTLAMWEWEGGVNETHQEFAGRVTEFNNGMVNQLSAKKHPNAVACVMMGQGVSNNAHGAAFEANLHAYKWSGGLADLVTVANDGVIRFSNHSYYTAYGSYGQYTSHEEYCDALVYSAYYHLPVFAAGNARTSPFNIYNADYDTLTAGHAKNVLGVGGVEDLVGGYLGASNVVMTSYSSWGPTDDGRIKPDIVASGYPEGIPALSGDEDYFPVDTSYVGTSFASPAVTGSLGLLQELHGRLYGTNGVPILASTYKGIAIHTADEAGGAPGPDYRFGWGLMNTHSAAQLMADNAEWNSSPFIKELMLPNGEYASYPVKADTNLPLRVTVCWSDPPGSTLQNDIDLRIIGPTGQTNFPWVLNPTQYPADLRGAPASRGDNTRDNVEQVEVTNTVAGAYTVLIDHKGALVDGGQELSLVLTGLIPEYIHPDVEFAITTNGFPRFDIPDLIGAVYKISLTDHLRYSPWQEVPESPLSVLQLQTEWIDPAGSTNPARFYKIERTR